MSLYPQTTENLVGSPDRERKETNRPLKLSYPHVGEGGTCTCWCTYTGADGGGGEREVLLLGYRVDS